jgi:hypothetical protein
MTAFRGGMCGTSRARRVAAPCRPARRGNNAGLRRRCGNPRPRARAVGRSTSVSALTFGSPAAQLVLRAPGPGASVAPCIACRPAIWHYSATYSAQWAGGGWDGRRRPYRTGFGIAPAAVPSCFGGTIERGNSRRSRWRRMTAAPWQSCLMAPFAHSAHSKVTLGPASASMRSCARRCARSGPN